MLYLTDRLSTRGGADQHLLQVISATVAAGDTVTVAYGFRTPEVRLPTGVTEVRIKGLAAKNAGDAGLGATADLVDRHQRVHVQNVMNPTLLARAVAGGTTLVTVQDHRVLCPGLGKTLPNREPCRQLMSESACVACLRDASYRRRMLDLTRARRDALQGARLLVLSRYMAAELATVGLPGAEVSPPFVEVGRQRSAAGQGFILGGRLVHHKDVVKAWQAWREAATGQVLRIAGAGPLAARLQGAELLGWLPQAELRQQLRRSRALLFPSLWQEPFGILGVEALAEGTPVIVADTGGTSEWSDAGCIPVPAEDTAALVAALTRLDHDPQLALTLGRSGRAMVAERFARAPIEARLRRL